MTEWLISLAYVLGFVVMVALMIGLLHLMFLIFGAPGIWGTLVVGGLFVATAMVHEARR